MKQLGNLMQVVNLGPQRDPVSKFLSDVWVRASMEGDALPKRRYAELSLKMVNEGELSATDWVSLQAGADSEAHGEAMRPDPEIVASWRQTLAQVVADPHEMRRVLGPFMLDALKYRIVGLPAIDTASNDTDLNFRIMGRDQFVGLDYGMLLLVTKYATELCRCKLQSCGKLFLVEPIPTGRPQRKYCDDAHRAEFFNLGAAERVRKSRIEAARRKAEAAKRSRKGKS